MAELRAVYPELHSANESDLYWYAHGMCDSTAEGRPDAGIVDWFADVPAEHLGIESDRHVAARVFLLTARATLCP